MKNGLYIFLITFLILFSIDLLGLCLSKNKDTVRITESSLGNAEYTKSMEISKNYLPTKGRWILYTNDQKIIEIGKVTHPRTLKVLMQDGQFLTLIIPATK